MLEDRIIVQDRGIDAGLAALMQNANKGSMDPAALLAMMNNNGMGGNGGWWWIWIILLFFCWGGNGFGFGGRNAGALASELNTDANTNLLMQAINGNKDAISTLSTTLNCDINSVQTALNTINTGVSQIACDTKLASCEVINAITSGNASLASQQAQTANIVSQLKSPCPVPAYFVPNPNCCPFDYYRYLLNRDNTTTAPAA